MITLRNVTLRRGTKVVLAPATAPITPGAQVGLLGELAHGHLVQVLPVHVPQARGDLPQLHAHGMAVLAHEATCSRGPASAMARADRGSDS